MWGFKNPWNFAAKMMAIRPAHFWSLVSSADTYDVVHVVMPLNLSGVWVLAMCKLLRFMRHKTTPVLICSWHCNLQVYNEFMFPRRLHGFMEKLSMTLFLPIARFADRLLVPTPSTEPAMRGAFGERWGIAPNGLELGSFNPRARETPSGELWEQRKREALAASGCTHLLLCVGRLSPEKGVQDLIAVMPRLPHCLLWLVGDGPARAPLEEQAAKGASSGKVAFWGYQRGEALSAVYTVADCFVCPSRTETFGQTVNEALASGTAVAVPRVGCFVEAYDGILDREAQMWTPGDEDGMAATIGAQLRSGADADAPPSPTHELKSWKTAVEELHAEYCAVDVAAEQRVCGARKRLGGILMILAYPYFFVFTTVIACLVFLISCLRAAIGGVGVRFFLRSRVAAAAATIERAKEASPLGRRLFPRDRPKKE